MTRKRVFQLFALCLICAFGIHLIDYHWRNPSYETVERFVGWVSTTEEKSMDLPVSTWEKQSVESVDSPGTGGWASQTVDLPLSTGGIKSEDLPDRIEEKESTDVIIKTDKESADLISSTEKEIVNLLIDTDGCKIPITPVFPEFYKKKWKIVKNAPDCTYESNLSTLSDDGIITLNQEFLDSDCCLHEISRIENNDKEYNMSICQEFTTDPINVTSKEILLTKCGKSLNFAVNMPIKPAVQKKLNHWKSIPSDELPPSIILFGFDTMSRLHAYRGLPKTLEFMKKMGFADFKGYHSLAPETLPNFLALLLGLKYNQVRGGGGCAPEWRSPFDPCPFIWKEFNSRHYVSMYVEDGSQSFNWGNQGGFDKSPSDYYMHPLFNAVKKLRMEHSPVDGDEDSEKIMCTSSTESYPQFIIRYTKRFLEKFQDVPTFSLSWNSNPIHDNQMSITNLDDELLELFQFLKSHPDLLRRTLIVFLSDHGDRYSFFMTESVEGYVERGLPAFFMRFPESLKANFPEVDLDQVINKNSEALTSPFDLHETLQHILFLDEGNNIRSNKFKFDPSVTLPDRSTLFKLVPHDRTCESIHVDPAVCVCNSSLTVEPLENPYYRRKMTEFAEEMLRKIVKDSKYEELCKEWSVEPGAIGTSRLVQKTADSADYLLQFLADPGDAKFEARIRVFYNSSKLELLGVFERVSAYKNQSFCIPSVTVADKRMKGFCFCK